MDIKQEKAEAFAMKIIELFAFLKQKSEFVISKQILRSETSIGANIAESIYSEDSHINNQQLKNKIKIIRNATLLLNT